MAALSQRPASPVPRRRGAPCHTRLVLLACAVTVVVLVGRTSPGEVVSGNGPVAGLSGGGVAARTHSPAPVAAHRNHRANDTTVFGDVRAVGQHCGPYLARLRVPPDRLSALWPKGANGVVGAATCVWSPGTGPVPPQCCCKLHRSDRAAKGFWGTPARSQVPGDEGGGDGFGTLACGLNPLALHRAVLRFGDQRV